MKKRKKLKNTLKEIIPSVIIENKIFIIRGQKVMLDSDLANMYGVPTMRLNEQVKRNIKRFPLDFMFQLTQKEKREVIANCDNLARLKFSSHLPYVFTEHGVAMLSSVLNSSRAVKMNIYIIRAFIKMREILAIDKNLELKLLQFQMVLKQQGKDIDDIIDKLNWLTDRPLKPPGHLGFRP